MTNLRSEIEAQTEAAANCGALLTLEQACEEFVGGKFTPATLRAEHGRGRLNLFKIGRQHFTTIADLREMKELCRVPSPVRGSGSIRGEEHGLSSTAEAEAAQASLLMKLDALKKPSATTSRRSTSSKTAPRHLSPTS